MGPKSQVDVEVGAATLTVGNESPTRSSSSTETEEGPLWTAQNGKTVRFLSRPMSRVAPIVFLVAFALTCSFDTLLLSLHGYLRGTPHGVEYIDSDNGANQYLYLCQVLAFSTPVVLTVLVDAAFGAHACVRVFSVISSIGLGLLLASTLTHNRWMIDLGMMGMISPTAAVFEVCLGVFGATQFHPQEHADLIVLFWTYYTSVLNAGCLTGSIAVPILQQSVSWFAAFSVPFGVMLAATVAFLVGRKRYVILEVDGRAVQHLGKALLAAASKLSFTKCDKAHGGKFGKSVMEDARMIVHSLPIFLLASPFFVAQSQMVTTYVTQGRKMYRDIGGWEMPSELMYNVNNLGAILCGPLIAHFIYCPLMRRGAMPSTTTRFAIGSVLSCGSILCAFGVERAIKAAARPNELSIFAQIPQYLLIACAETFSMNTGYEFAFINAPEYLRVVPPALFLLFRSLSSFVVLCLAQTAGQSMITDYDPASSDADIANAISGSRFDVWFLILAAITAAGALAGFITSALSNSQADAEEEEEEELSETQPLEEISAAAKRRRRQGLFQGVQSTKNLVDDAALHRQRRQSRIAARGNLLRQKSMFFMCSRAPMVPITWDLPEPDAEEAASFTARRRSMPDVKAKTETKKRVLRPTQTLPAGLSIDIFTLSSHSQFSLDSPTLFRPPAPKGVSISADPPARTLAVQAGLAFYEPEEVESEIPGGGVRLLSDSRPPSEANQEGGHPDCSEQHDGTVSLSSVADVRREEGVAPRLSNFTLDATAASEEPEEEFLAAAASAIPQGPHVSDPQGIVQPELLPLRRASLN